MNKKIASFKEKYLSGMHKKTIAIILAVTAVFIVAIILWGTSQPKEAVAPAEAASMETGDFQPGIVYYYGQACTYCKNIEKFIVDEKIADKISFVKKEVLLDQSNDMEMRERAKACGLNPEKVGVPFLWAKDKCYIGEVEVEKFLSEQVKGK